MNDFDIESGHPLPGPRRETRGRPVAYPFAELAKKGKGYSFFVPGKNMKNHKNGLNSTLRTWNLKLAPRIFVGEETTKDGVSGVRVTMIQ